MRKDMLWSVWPFSCLRAPKRVRHARERFLLPKEWTAIKQVLDQRAPKIRIYFYLLLLEGSRMSELRYMRWEHVDLDAWLWFKPITKTKRAQTLPLSHPACQLLNSLPRTGSYVFPGEHGHVPWSATAVEYHWRKIRWLAGCPDVQIRDLRRTLGSWMTIHGENLIIIKDILHHTDIKTTQVYAKSSHGAQFEALRRHSERIMGPSHP